MEENKKRKKIVWIICVIIILILGIVVYIVYDNFLKINKTVPNYEDNSTTTNNNGNIVLYDGKKGDKTYFYENKYSEDDISYSSSNEILKNGQYVEYTLLGEYVCKYDGCTILDTVNKKYAIIYDKDYFIYDIETSKKIKNLKIEKIKYNSINGLYNKDDKVVGIVLNKETDTYKEDYRLSSAYYDVKKEKIIIDFGKYSNIYSDKVIIEKGYIICELGIVYDDDYRSVLYNINENQVEKENINGYITGKNNAYFYYGESEAETYISKIYDENFNLIYESKNEDDYVSNEEYYITDDDKLILAANNTFYVYNDEYQLEYTSKKYNVIYNIFKDYIAVNENGFLKILNYKEEEKANLCEVKENNYVHYMISGWYTDNGKNGIYMVVSDESAAKELTKEEIEQTEEVGYEYYYIPTTGETGRIAAPIGGYAKPVLYLYPTANNTLINVTFDKPNLLTTTYPKYQNSWSVIANTNGDLIDKNGRYYYGLYWEEKGNTKIDFTEGFYVEESNAIKFLEQKLDEIGLNQREANEFIMYWLPILEKNKKSLVYFELTEERQQYNRINITPSPDSLLRLAIHIKQVDKKNNIKEQKLDKFERKGFTAVEWGGTIH